jgi:hypothetical protein
MKTRYLLINLGLIAALLLAGCSFAARVGALRTESQSVELGEAKSVRVAIAMGARDLEVTGSAEKLLEAGFNYNVDKLKPEVEYTDGKLVVRQPDIQGFPVLQNITDFRNEWNLHLNNEVPMDLRVDMGGGTSHLQLAGLSLTSLDITLGAGQSTIDLSGDWARDLNVTIDSGAANVSLRLPKDVGARVKVESGPHTIEATDMTKDGDVYTTAAYGMSAVTMQVDMGAGIGQISLDVEK